MTYKPSKLGQTDSILVYNQSSSVGLCMQDHFCSNDKMVWYGYS